MAEPRATGPAPKDPSVVGLPFRVFMYTFDQICLMLDKQIEDLRRNIIYYEGRTLGARPRDKLKALNIAPHEDKPDWRVSEQELIRWMRVKGIQYYERGWGK